jgi:L-ornithine N5-monooxygenase
VSHGDIELVAIGAGPSNLALAVALEELAPDLAEKTVLLERQDTVAWQRGMLLPWARTQVSCLKDLVTLRNPRSEFTFINYLHVSGRLDQFVNLDTLRPYRIEISDYLNWVASSLKRVRIEYGSRCVGIEPVRSAGGEIGGWQVQLAGGTTIHCRDLVIGGGRDPRVPEVFAGLRGPQVVHSSEYCAHPRMHDPSLPQRIVVVGGAQSAVELLWASHQWFPLAECTLITRSIALQSYEHSKFANEIYFPSFVDDFFAASAEARCQMLAAMHRTNYGAADPELLDTLYREIYLGRVTGSDRLRLRTMTDVVAARPDGDQLELTLLDRRTGRSERLSCDQVLLGTGYTSAMPALVRDLADAVGLDEITVDRNYRLAMPWPDDGASVYLQGVNEATHGIADSLLSVLAVRAGEIATDLTDRRVRRRRGRDRDRATFEVRSWAGHG